MEKYFEGIIEYTISNIESDIEAFQIAVIVKGENYRIDSPWETYGGTTIGKSDNLFQINHKNKRIVNCGRVSSFEKSKIRIETSEEIEKIQNFKCKATSVKYDSENQNRSFSETHFIAPNFKIHPKLSCENLYFLTGHLPLKISRVVKIDKKLVNVIYIASKIEEFIIEQEMFDLKLFSNYESLSYKENELKVERERKEKRAKQEKEHALWLKTWDEGKDERAKQEKVLGEKIVLFLEKELNRKLTLEQRKEPHKFFINYMKNLNEEEASKTSQKFIEYL